MATSSSVSAVVLDIQQEVTAYIERLSNSTVHFLFVLQQQEHGNIFISDLVFFVVEFWCDAEFLCEVTSPAADQNSSHRPGT